MRDPLLYNEVGSKLITNGKRMPIEFKLNRNGHPILEWKLKKPSKKLFSISPQKRPFPCPSRAEALSVSSLNKKAATT